MWFMQVAWVIKFVAVDRCTAQEWWVGNAQPVHNLATSSRTGRSSRSPLFPWPGCTFDSWQMVTDFKIIVMTWNHYSHGPLLESIQGKVLPFVFNCLDVFLSWTRPLNTCSPKLPVRIVKWKLLWKFIYGDFKQFCSIMPACHILAPKWHFKQHEFY